MRGKRDSEGETYYESDSSNDRGEPDSNSIDVAKGNNENEIHMSSEGPAAGELLSLSFVFYENSPLPIAGVDGLVDGGSSARKGLPIRMQYTLPNASPHKATQRGPPVRQ